MSFQVDPAELRNLAGVAAGLGEEIGSLGSAVPEAGAEAVGDPGLAAALAAFNESWAARAAELRAELSDAAEFLLTFADSAEALDDRLSQ